MHRSVRCVPDAMGVMAASLAMTAAGDAEFFVDKTCAPTVASEGADCPGDSGGPIRATEAGGRWTRVGIVSYGAPSPQSGEECGLTVSSVYVNVHHLDAWIRAVTLSGN